jgi:Fur family peroxide stress response transcriptional regulator
MVQGGELRRRMQAFEEALRRAGLKRTQQRIEIYREVARSEEHPDVETVCRRVRKRLPSVSTDTVYRVLWQFVDLGLIATLGPARDRLRFDANPDAHHHFVCVRCGMTRDFRSRELAALKVPTEARAFGRANSTHAEVRGVCRKCGAGKRGT